MGPVEGGRKGWAMKGVMEPLGFRGTSTPSTADAVEAKERVNAGGEPANSTEVLWAPVSHWGIRAVSLTGGGPFGWAN